MFAGSIVIGGVEFVSVLYTGTGRAASCTQKYCQGEGLSGKEGKRPAHCRRPHAAGASDRVIGSWSLAIMASTGVTLTRCRLHHFSLGLMMV
jgi:hypothetical protein